MNSYYGTLQTPIGELCVIANEQGITHIKLFKEEWESYLEAHEVSKEANKWCRQGIKELKEYFEGKRIHFDVPLSVEGTSFRRAVWEALKTIPYGEVATYKDVARKVNNEKAVRAVGGANRANTIPIIIPCHRVIGSNGKMIGYAGTHIDIKEVLLQLEQNYFKDREDKR